MTKALDIVVNLWNEEVTRNYPEELDQFWDLITLGQETTHKGISLDEQIRRMDAAGVGKGLMVATTGGDVGSRFFFEKHIDIIHRVCHKGKDDDRRPQTGKSDEKISKFPGETAGDAIWRAGSMPALHDASSQGRRSEYPRDTGQLQPERHPVRGRRTSRIRVPLGMCPYSFVAAYQGDLVLDQRQVLLQERQFVYHRR